MKISIKDIFSKYDQIRSFLFCAVLKFHPSSAAFFIQMNIDSVKLKFHDILYIRWQHF